MQNKALEVYLARRRQHGKVLPKEGENCWENYLAYCSNRANLDAER